MNASPLALSLRLPAPRQLTGCAERGTHRFLSAASSGPAQCLEAHSADLSRQPPAAAPSAPGPLPTLRAVLLGHSVLVRRLYFPL